MSQPAYRSPWGKHVGGASQRIQIPVGRAGYRSLLWFAGGGADKPLPIGEYAGPRSLLAFWMGGAALNYKPKPPYEPIIGPDGPGYARHHERGRPLADDTEVEEFLRLWVVWNDIEGP